MKLADACLFNSKLGFVRCSYVISALSGLKDGITTNKLKHREYGQPGKRKRGALPLGLRDLGILPPVQVYPKES